MLIVSMTDMYTTIAQSCIGDHGQSFCYYVIRKFYRKSLGIITSNDGFQTISVCILMIQLNPTLDLYKFIYLTKFNLEL